MFPCLSVSDHLLGLAPLAIEDVVQRLVQLAAGGTTLLLVEQNATAAFRIAHRGYVLNRGEVVASGSVAELQADQRVHDAYLGG